MKRISFVTLLVFGWMSANATIITTLQISPLSGAPGDILQFELSLF